MTKVKVLIVDDSVTIRAMFEELLEMDPALEVVGTAADADEARELMRETLPDVIALDIEMPGLGGLAFLEEIRGFWRKVAVIMVSSSTTRAAPVCEQAFENGAFACFDKSNLVANCAKLARLIKEAAAGEMNRAAHRGAGVTFPNHREPVALPVIEGANAEASLQ